MGALTEEAVSLLLISILIPLSYPQSHATYPVPLQDTDVIFLKKSEYNGLEHE